ncbi:L,D-transpeptidase [Cognatishimia sp. SS12]|uniref:L,D-transpeptidase n=1 Tax=Cognatishimia sp. SS12 TaxID=2979465 RepID=UPI002330E443|nr:L,D-transpeptidase [Cognatishimia sp. SS12]MDC0738813.1 L,D-transpeptidase [Cognatishimia sp. SS12]
MLTRRHFISTTTALFSAPIAGAVWAQSDETAAPATAVETPEVATAPEVAPVRAPTSNPRMWSSWDARVTPANYDPATSNPWGLHPRFLPQRVEANDGLVPGDIHVDAVARYLYHIAEDGSAMRYGVAIAKGKLYEPGTYTIARKRKWPTWRPTDAMIKREPQTYEKHANGMDGGPSNPLGSRALYLYVGNRDTYLRIHGTPSPRSIGGRASSGCVRMVMAHINGLYDNVAEGSTAFLYAPE